MKYRVKHVKGQPTKRWLFGLAAVIIVAITVNTGQSLPRFGAADIAVKAKAAAPDSLDNTTGLIVAPGLAIVKTACVKCHSPKLITQKRATREGWVATIRWMQQTQGLWDLGKDESAILEYLAKNYAPQNQGRRPLLKVDKWYQLNN
jgi:hypothetical protein